MWPQKPVTKYKANFAHLLTQGWYPHSPDYPKPHIEEIWFEKDKIKYHSRSKSIVKLKNKENQIIFWTSYSSFAFSNWFFNIVFNLSLLLSFNSITHIIKVNITKFLGKTSYYHRYIISFVDIELFNSILLNLNIKTD